MGSCLLILIRRFNISPLLIEHTLNVVQVICLGKSERQQERCFLGAQIAVTTATRADVLPEIPIMGDCVLGYEASAWLGFGAPKDTLGRDYAALRRYRFVG